MEKLIIFMGCFFLLVIPGLTFNLNESVVISMASKIHTTEIPPIFNQTTNDTVVNQERNAHIYSRMENMTQSFSTQVLTNETQNGKKLTESKLNKSMIRLANSSLLHTGNKSQEMHGNSSTIQRIANSSNPDNSHLFIICPAFHYPCDDNKTCIRNELVCNGISECPDQSDEIGVCQAKEIEVVVCNNGQILKGIGLICNNIVECADGSDEINCEGLSHKMCEDSMTFSCRDSHNTCLHPHKRCDSYTDCENGLDEFPVLCSFNPTVHVKASFSYSETVIIYEDPKTLCDFECDNGMQCLPQYQVCDKVYNCNDMEDELYCPHDEADTEPKLGEKAFYKKPVPIVAMSVFAFCFIILMIVAVYFGMKKHRMTKSKVKRVEINRLISSYHHLVTPPAYEEVTKADNANTATGQNQVP